MRTNWIISVVLLVFLYSCQQKQSKTLITQKIQYDVSIVSPNPAYDPWIQNIEESTRYELVSTILRVAYEGKIQAYDYFNKPLSLQELKSLGVDTTYRTLTRSTPPYAEYDTVITSKIEVSDITKIRFLEEWYLDEENLVIEKVIKGIAPVVDKYDHEGNFIGLFPLFWIYKDELDKLNK